MDNLNSILNKLPVDEREQLTQLIIKQQKTIALHQELIKQLNQAMALNKVVLNAAGEGIVAIDESLKIIDLNPALAEMFGYTQRELKGQKLGLIFSGKTLQKCFGDQPGSGEKPQSLTPGSGSEKRIDGLHKTKGPFKVSVVISHGLKNGERIYTGIIRDLTRQDCLAQENEKQAQKLVNRTKELEGLYILSKLLEEDSIPAIFEKLFRDIVPKTTSYPDKAVVIAELDGRAYRSRNEAPVVSLSSELHNGTLTFGFTEDVPYGTGRHQNLLDLFTAELDHVILRTKARQRELQIERKAASSELESGVAHNVNNGLQIIQGYAQVALGLAKSLEIKEPLEKIRSKTRELGKTIRGIQQPSGHKPGKDNFEIIDLGELLCDYLASVENPLKSEALRQGITVTINKQIGIDTFVFADKEDVILITQALIKNSIDSLLEDGNIDIDVSRTGEYVHLQVKDTGKGMSETEQQKLFDRYFTTKDPETRTGLGLSHAQTIAREHGGEIKLLKSRVGHGTTMELSLPYAHHQEESVHDLEEDTAQENTQKKCLNILWAEDDIVIQETVKMMARSFDDQIDFVENGQMALDMLQQKTYDVLVTDIGMPIMGGWKLLKCIEGYYDNMTRVLASGYVINATDMNASGASFLLNKPLDKNELVNVLENIKTRPPAGSTHSLRAEIL
ncbi:MAG: ATP-binding protein [Xanthomonadales bacterium]|nr:ATP-binding protein [Xanthomonadales bacterium]